MEYSGESVDPEKRFQQHRRDAVKGTKEAYEFARQQNIVESFEMEVVDGVSEDELHRELTLQGHRLFNSKGGNASVKKRKRVESDFTRLNREADERLTLKEAAAARRNVLHNDRQSLSKSEIVQQRITNAAPTWEELDACQWFECPGELIDAKIGKTAERAEYCKWGDFIVVVAFRKKDKEMVIAARHTSGREHRIGGWARWTRWVMLSQLCRYWDGRHPGANE